MDDACVSVTQFVCCVCVRVLLLLLFVSVSDHNFMRICQNAEVDTSIVKIEIESLDAIRKVEWIEMRFISM